MIQRNMSLYDSLFMCCEKQYFQAWAQHTVRQAGGPLFMFCLAYLLVENRIFQEYFIAFFCKSFTKQVVYSCLIISL